ncbi:MAG TPA: transcriptional regulator [Candidatus Saccharimonadales bacterium]|nr:transcriptional regulator [Candidatus Saccharimonadales bacterium]
MDNRGRDVIEQLFGSKTRVKLLQLFYSNPNRSFYVREITRKIDEQINSVRRELSNLLSIGIIKSDATNNRLYYEVNQNYEFYRPLAAIFGGQPMAAEPAAKAASKKEAKASPIPTPKADVSSEHPMAKSLRGLGKVDLALLSGQFTRDDSSGVDVLIVGDINQAKADKFIAELEKSENKELRYAVLPTSNYEYRLQINDRFISNVLGAKKQVIINAKDLTV